MTESGVTKLTSS